jgi:hypothetical protein
MGTGHRGVRVDAAGERNSRFPGGNDNKKSKGKGKNKRNDNGRSRSFTSLRMTRSVCYWNDGVG